MVTINDEIKSIFARAQIISDKNLAGVLIKLNDKFDTMTRRCHDGIIMTTDKTAIDELSAELLKTTKASLRRK